MIAIKKKFDNIDDGIANMIAAANYDYNSFMPENKEMCDDFANGWVVKRGKKYIKIISSRSAWTSCLRKVIFWNVLGMQLLPETKQEVTSLKVDSQSDGQGLLIWDKLVLCVDKWWEAMV